MLAAQMETPQSARPSSKWRFGVKLESVNKRAKVKMGEFSIAKLTASALGGLIMYWMYIPQPVIVLLTMMTIDLLLGSLEAWSTGKFSKTEFRRGVLRKFIPFPVLVACDQIEGPLHLNFHLDAYFALALTVYEFISIVQVYARMGGPVPKVLMIATEKAKEFLSTGTYQIQGIKTTEHTIERMQPAMGPGGTFVTHKETTVEPVVSRVETKGE